MHADELRTISLRGKHNKLDAEAQKREKLASRTRQLKKMDEYRAGYNMGAMLVDGVYKQLAEQAEGGRFSADVRVEHDVRPIKPADHAWVMGAADRVADLLRQEGELHVETGPVQWFHDYDGNHTPYVTLSVRW